jgi:tRNA-dihydrouridine synthase A
VIVNGGLRTVPQVSEQLAHVDGVMLGREAYHNPFLLSALHRALFDDGFVAPAAAQVIAEMRGYAERQLAAGTPLSAITRHLLGLFNGRAGARAWRRALAEGAARPGATPALLEAASRAAAA